MTWHAWCNNCCHAWHCLLFFCFRFCCRVLKALARVAREICCRKVIKKKQVKEKRLNKREKKQHLKSLSIGLQVRGTQSSWLPPAVISPLPSPHPRILPCFGAPAGSQVSPFMRLTVALGDFQPMSNRPRTRSFDDWVSVIQHKR